MLGDLFDPFLLVGVGPTRRRRDERPAPPQVARQRWWRLLGAALLVLQQVPLTVGAVWLLGAAAKAAQDDLLMFVGFIAFGIAAAIAVTALGLLVGAAGLAVRVLQEHGWARFYVGGAGFLGLAASGTMVLGSAVHPLVTTHAALSVLLLLTALAAPADRRP